MSRLLGLDLGARRIGVAMGISDTMAATPLATISRGSPEDDARRIGRLVLEQRIDALVVGLPLLPSGEAGAQAHLARAWGEALGRRLGIAVRWQDERYTSVRAEAVVGPARRGHDGAPPGAAARARQRAGVDREAARRIVAAALEAGPEAIG